MSSHQKKNLYNALSQKLYFFKKIPKKIETSDKFSLKKMLYLKKKGIKGSGLKIVFYLYLF